MPKFGTEREEREKQNPGAVRHPGRAPGYGIREHWERDYRVCPLEPLSEQVGRVVSVEGML